MSDDNPQTIVKTRYILKMSLRGVGSNHNITVNGERYRDMNNDFFVLELEEVDVGVLWFQQIDATCRTANETTNWLKETFGGARNLF